MSETIEPDDYSLQAKSPTARIAAPALPYQPRDPKGYRPAIGMIACGGITLHHLTAYKAAGYNIVALCDLIPERAEQRRTEFFPDAMVTTDYREVLARKDIEVVDIATHPLDRVPLIEAALRAGKHVLSQKPFALDLGIAERFVEIADEQGVRLAVNQNGRWAPHFSYMREAVQRGLIGDLLSIHCNVHWDHTWIMGTPFEKIEDVILYDFSIHWFDYVSCLLGDRKVTRVQASKGRAFGQVAKPPMLAQAIIEFEGGQSSLAFDGHIPYGGEDRTYIGGTRGSLTSTGSDLASQVVRLFTAEGIATPRLQGAWFPDGFHGSMSELLCAISENREPSNSARNNLRSLALCYAAIASATDGKARTPGEVRRLPAGSAPGAGPREE